MARSLRHLERTTLRLVDKSLFLRHPERKIGKSSPATGTACEFIDFSGGNGNHGEKISP
jgi:hypothetical protein